MHGRSNAAFAAVAVALSVGLAVPIGARAQALDEVQAELSEAGGDRDIRAFYQARGFRPLWLGPRSGAAAERLIELLDTADIDGLRPRDYRVSRLQRALDDAREGSPEAAARAEMQLSESFAEYVRDLRDPARAPLLFTDPDLRPDTPDETAILEQAAAAASLERHVQSMGWMHPLYGQLRNALTEETQPDEAQLLRVNLDRIRQLPPAGAGRHIVVDTAGARLLMYENGQLRDSMRVIVGKEATPTPMLASTIRHATLNPYWNVPPDLVKERIAPQVISNGGAWLKTRQYDVLSDWSEQATVADPELVDWQAVAAGRKEIRVRQRPGPGNGMGAMKFMFPNQLGIYLHDTPDKSLFQEGGRQYSAGCIRLEDARRLARWLFGKPLATRSRTPEQRVELPRPVPIYVTYLTAFPGTQGIERRPDPYGRDFAATRGRGRNTAR